MKNIKFFRYLGLAVSAGLLLGFSSCSDDDSNKTVALETKTVTNLSAQQTGGQGQPVGGAFTKFSFS